MLDARAAHVHGTGLDDQRGWELDGRGSVGGAEVTATLSSLWASPLWSRGWEGRRRSRVQWRRGCGDRLRSDCWWDRRRPSPGRGTRASIQAWDAPSSERSFCLVGFVFAMKHVSADVAARNLMRRTSAIMMWAKSWHTPWRAVSARRSASRRWCCWERKRRICRSYWLSSVSSCERIAAALAAEFAGEPSRCGLD